MLRDLQGDFMASGPKRRLLYCPSLERVSKVLEDHLNKDSMGICMPHIWAGQCPQDVQQSHETCDGNSSGLGNSPDYISGRPSHYPGRLRTDCQTPSGNCSKSPRELGFC